MSEMLHLELHSGRVTIKLRSDLAPNHCARVSELAVEGFYDDTPIHRVIEGFMAQMGDPTGTGTGGSERPDLNAELSDVSHVRGICSMARTPDPNSANSQFFIVLADSPFLDGQYTVWGEVVEGMEHVAQIKKGGGRDGMVRQPDRIVRLRPAAAKS
ncbi:MAG: peptidylprolyl isomerase [Alphaproteobacteria bacterium]|nr:peptidylprolyl isomerase [Alphaproteobacteria bacterium]